MTTPTHQPFIASYPRDFEWLNYLLRSLRRFATGFLPPVVAVPPEFVRAARETFPDVTVVAQDAAPAKASKWRHFLCAQVAMLECDKHCPEADFVWLFGSDCFVYSPLTPDMGFSDGRPVMPSNSYAFLRSTGYTAPEHWRPGTKSALRFPLVTREYMRRLPLVYPRELYPAVRRHVEFAHRTPFREYVYSTTASRNFSESNVLGAYAAEYMQGAFHWLDLDGPGYDSDVKLPAIQFWSHGGLDMPCDKHHKYAGRTPRSVMDELLK